jgi:DNA-binding NtrC family response regulator
MLFNTQVKIVIVDDTPGISYFYKDVLEDEGFFKVRDFVDPKTVLSLVASGDLLPNIVISDFDMGEINGVVLLNSLLKANPGLKGIIVTGSPDRVTSLSQMYPVIDKDSQTAKTITVLVKKYADELALLK